MAAGDYVAAEAGYSELVDAATRQLGPDHADTRQFRADLDAARVALSAHFSKGVGASGSLI
jgi:hypothetical protein